MILGTCIVTKVDFRRGWHFPILASTALCVIQTLIPAHAESAAPDEGAGADGGEGLAEIRVTAERHETDLQKTPISMSVLQSADLDNRHVVSLASLTDGSVPSLNVAPFFARNSARWT
jgi:iron complex outermembrane recepter protein